MNEQADLASSQHDRKLGEESLADASKGLYRDIVDSQERVKNLEEEVVRRGGAIREGLLRWAVENAASIPVTRHRTDKVPASFGRNNSVKEDHYVSYAGRLSNIVDGQTQTRDVTLERHYFVLDDGKPTSDIDFTLLFSSDDGVEVGFMGRGRIIGEGSDEEKVLANVLSYHKKNGHSGLEVYDGETKTIRNSGMPAWLDGAPDLFNEGENLLMFLDGATLIQPNPQQIQQ